MVRFLLGASFSGWTLIRDLLSFLKDLSEAEATAPRPLPPVPQQKDGGGGGVVHTMELGLLSFFGNVSKP